MTKSFYQSIAFTAGGILLLSCAVPVAAETPYYRATFTEASVPEKMVSDDTMWYRGDASLTASQANDQPLFVCESLARDVGQLKSFEVQGKALSDVDLAKCNAKAHKRK